MPDDSRSLGPEGPQTVLQASRLVAAPAATIWRLMEDPTIWRLWFANCRNAATHDRKLLRDGSRLLLEWTEGWFALDLRGQVVAARPERYLLLQLGGLFRGSEWGCWLAPETGGTRVTLRWHLSPQTRLLSLALGGRRRLNQTLELSLRQLKRLAESR